MKKFISSAGVEHNITNDDLLTAYRQLKSHGIPPYLAFLQAADFLIGSIEIKDIGSSELVARKSNYYKQIQLVKKITNGKQQQNNNSIK